jgi:hypothetical protein
MHRSLKIQTLKWTSNDSTSLIENAIFLELGLYRSNYSINTIEVTVDVLWVLQTPGVLQFSLASRHSWLLGVLGAEVDDA